MICGLCVCVGGVGAGVHGCQKKASILIPGAAVTFGCVLPEVGAENLSAVLCKSSELS